MAGRPSRAMWPVGDGSMASRLSPWYDECMDTTPFDLTPEQKGMLASLSRETGKPIPVLLAKALEALQERERSDPAHNETNDHETEEAPTLQDTCQPIWERIRWTLGQKYRLNFLSVYLSCSCTT